MLQYYTNLSCFSCLVQTEKKTFAEEVNNAFREAANNEMKGILAVNDEPLVSIDFRCSDVSSTVDSSLTMVLGDDMVKVVAWYDNEWGKWTKPLPQERLATPFVVLDFIAAWDRRIIWKRRPASNASLVHLLSSVLHPL